MAKTNPKKSTDQTNKPTKKTEHIEDGLTLGGDYWNRVAEDAASGYKNKDDKDRILNEDQLPDDHERGDKETGEE
jgi:hypothetical protein